ncbi:MAG: HAMP domain-containing protein [Deltaproteobacteria bacterium]|nr:MAG: HAMP domain-containing protein [Deltaproteobacteria bacterium]
MDFFLLRSIRFRLTFWYALTLAVILAASALFSFQYFSKTLRQQVDDQLLAISSEIATAHASHADQPFDCNRLQDHIHQGNWDAYILLRGPNLQAVCASENLLVGDLEFGPVAMQQVRWLNPHFETVEIASGMHLRLLSSPLTHNGHLIGVVQVARNLGQVQQILGELRLVYSLVGPFAIFWLCLGCWFLADQLVSPVVEITAAAREINSENLARRLPHPGHRDELGQMVLSFNQMLERLESAFRRIRQFSGDASHELRTPLTILRGETEVTLRWAKTPEEFRDMLRSNMEEIDRMERIIENLLLLAKSESGELTLELREFNLSDLVQALYMQGRTLGEAKRISVNLRVDVDEEMRIRGDELRLRQMFLNLIANGIKYTPEGGALEIAMSRDGEMARIDVADNGIGIPVEAQPYIFDRFYRVDKARNRMDGGSGLGLSIVKSIAVAHGGRISVHSSPGQGSTFTVLLPINGPSEVAPRPAILG